VKKKIIRKKTDRESLILGLARQTKEREGELEFDDTALVSEGDDNGAYVQAWVWVPFAGTPLCTGDGRGNHDDCEPGCPIFDQVDEEIS
jgi:hypothetical protein